MKRQSKKLPSSFSRRSKPQIRQRDWSKLFAIAASFVGATTIILALVGFGVALSAETQLNVPYASIFSSTSELIALSAIAFSRYIVVVSSWTLIRETLMKSLTMSASLALFMFVLWLTLCAFHKPVSSAAQRWRARFQVAIAVQASERGKLRWLAEAAFLSLLVLVIQPLLMLGSLFVVIAFILIVSMAPLLGVTAGKSYIKKYVLAPRYCIGAPLATAAKEDRATCLTIRTKELGTFSGRLVFATSSVAVLYNPADPNGVRVRRVPISEAVLDLEKELKPGAKP
jgi:hypothetical protein